MKKIKRDRDHWGEYVIYVQKCDRYKYENPEEPKVKIPVDITQNYDILCDIIDTAENYF